MAQATLNFIDLLRQSGLVDGARLQAYLNQLPPDIASQNQLVAERMIADKLLTPFQANLLLKGRYKGFILRQKYKILDLLGVGGMGRVFLCEHMHLNRLVAVKLLLTNHIEDPSNLERFYREARAVASLDDPNIVRVYDVERDDKMPLMVMEYIDGISLLELVRRSGPLTVAAATNFIAQTALGLQHAFEAGVIHRDIKPSNLLLDQRGVIKILDMGLARFIARDKNQQLTEKFDSNSVLGTADYLAPEQAINSSQVDIRADLYAVGGTLFYLLTGKPPFEAQSVAEKLVAHQMKPIPSLREFRADVPPKLESIFRRLMAKLPAERFATPAELLLALVSFADPNQSMPIPLPGKSETIDQSRSNTTRTIHRPYSGVMVQPEPKRSRRTIWLVASFIGLLAIGGGIWWLNRPPTIETNTSNDSTQPKQVDPPALGQIIAPDEAIRYAGLSITVEMKVIHTGYNNQSNPTILFLNSMVEFRDPKSFTIMLRRDVAEKLFPETNFGALAEKFEGKTVRITGKVIPYRDRSTKVDRAEVVVEEAEQLKLID